MQKLNTTYDFRTGTASSSWETVSKGIQNKALMDALTITAGGLSGGISASISGGKFWDGARQGLITAGLNHLGNHLGLRNGPPETEKTAKELGITPNQTSQEQIGKVDYNMKVGDYVKGSEFSFIDKNAPLAVSKVEKIGSSEYRIKPTLLGRVKIKSDAKLTISESNLSISEKNVSVYKVKIHGIDLPKFKNGIVYFYKNRMYFHNTYDNNKLYYLYVRLMSISCNASYY